MKIKLAEHRLQAGHEEYTFRCPGCKDMHSIAVKRSNVGPTWEFNRNVEKPTFSPSLLVRAGHHAPGYLPGESCWCTFDQEAVAKGEPLSGFKCYVCHSFIKDGEIQFLSDCTHAMAGKTVPLEDVA